MRMGEIADLRPGATGIREGVRCCWLQQTQENGDKDDATLTVTGDAHDSLSEKIGNVVPLLSVRLGSRVTAGGCQLCGYTERRGRRFGRSKSLLRVAAELPSTAYRLCSLAGKYLTPDDNEPIRCSTRSACFTFG
jgi:hypothetical protein